MYNQQERSRFYNGLTCDEFLKKNAINCSKEFLAEQSYIMVHTIYFKYFKNKIHIDSEFEKQWKEKFGIDLTDESLNYLKRNEPVMTKYVLLDDFLRYRSFNKPYILSKIIVACEFDLWLIDTYFADKPFERMLFKIYLDKKYGDFLNIEYKNFEKFDLHNIVKFDNIVAALYEYYDNIKAFLDLIIKINKVSVKNQDIKRTDVSIEPKKVSKFIPQKESSLAQKESSSAQRTSSSAQKESSSLQKESRLAQKESSSTQKESSSAQKESSSTQKESSSAQKESSSAQKESSSAQKESTSAQKESTSAQKESTSAQHTKAKKQSEVKASDSSKKDEKMQSVIREFELIIRDKDEKINSLENDIREFKRQRDEIRDYSTDQYNRGIKDLFRGLNDLRYGKVIDYFYSLMKSPDVDEKLGSYLENFFMALEDAEIEPIIADENFDVNSKQLIKEFNLDFDKSKYNSKKVKLKYYGWKYKDSIIEKPSLTIEE